MISWFSAGFRIENWIRRDILIHWGHFHWIKLGLQLMIYVKTILTNFEINQFKILHLNDKNRNVKKRTVPITSFLSTNYNSSNWLILSILIRTHSDSITNNMKRRKGENLTVIDWFSVCLCVRSKLNNRKMNWCSVRYKLLQYETLLFVNHHADVTGFHGILFTGKFSELLPLEYSL